MQLIPLNVLTRRGVAVNQQELIDIADIIGPVTEHVSGATFLLREGKRGTNINTAAGATTVEYVVSETVSEIATLTTNLFSVNVETVRGRVKEGSPMMTFNIDNVCATIKPEGTGSAFFYQEDTDPDMVLYTCSQTILDILEQVSLSSSAPATVELPPVLSQTNTPPGAPTSGDRYLIGTSPDDPSDWEGKPNQIAEWDGLNWVFTVPVTNNTVFVADTLTTLRYTGAAWIPYPGTAILQNGNALGVPVIIGSNDNRSLIFKTNNTPQVYVTATGNVGFGAIPSSIQKFLIDHATAGSDAEFQDQGYFRTRRSADVYMLYNPVGSQKLILRGLAANGTVGFDFANEAGESCVLEVGAGRSQFLASGYFDLYVNYPTTGVPALRINTSGNFLMGSAGAAPFTSRLLVKGSDTGATYGFIAISSDDSINFSVSNDGAIFMPKAQTGTVGLVSGQIYFDTAANILAAGNLVCGRKV